MNKKGWKYFFWNDGEPMCRSDFKANHSGIQPALLDKMYPGQVNKKEIQAAHSTGDFYAATCGSKDPDKRNAFKSEVQLYHYASANKRRSCVEYGKTRWKWVKKDRPIDRIMADKYPDYHKMCSNMSKGEKRLMSHINMKVETSIMVDTGKDLMAMGIEEFIQIHDCMMGRYQNRKVTEQRMVGNAQRILDFTMEVKSDEPKFL